jgi:[NiFe] hydrogenase diaphorase moiety large subunit
MLAALEARRAQGCSARRPRGTGFDFDIELHLGAGAYVCGEESALIESLEGKRGIPRNRPPYPVTHGYMRRPTVVNNVETLVAAALRRAHGATDFLTRRRHGASPGTKLLSVSGDVARPGVYEYPFGVTVRQVLDDAGASDTQAVQVGGPSGVLLAASELEPAHRLRGRAERRRVHGLRRPTRDMLAVVDNFARFFAHESCGFCTPCRVGTTLNARHDGRVAPARARAAT